MWFGSLLLPIRVLVHQRRQYLHELVTLLDNGILRAGEETAFPENTKPVTCFFDFSKRDLSFRERVAFAEPSSASS